MFCIRVISDSGFVFHDQNTRCNAVGHKGCAIDFSFYSILGLELLIEESYPFD